MSSILFSRKTKKHKTRKHKIRNHKKGKLYKKYITKTKKNIKKKSSKRGGDIAYYPLAGATPTPIWTPTPTSNVVCSDDNVCLAFGDLTEDIKTFFNGFINFDFVVSPIERIGTVSVNGFISQIKYEKDGYNSYAILKSTAKPNADNLMYEYIVGQYVNKLNKQYPCFVETYGLYKYTCSQMWNIFKDNQQGMADATEVSQLLKLGLTYETEIDYNLSCKESQYMAILIENLKDIRPLMSLLYNQEFLEYELMNALFQIYIPLAKLKNNFTHYDLHLNNIQVYEPVEEKYIQYHYSLLIDSQPVVVSFKSKYMMKILDYGRCYFNDETTGINSKEIYDKQICNENASPECNPYPNACGKFNGYAWLEDDTPNPTSRHYISGQHKNISHDLRALYNISQFSLKPQMKPKFQNKQSITDFLDKVVYVEEYGTSENVSMGYPRTINNVEDAAKYLTDYVSKLLPIRKNDRYYQSNIKLGDLYIDMVNDTPMNFVPA